MNGLSAREQKQALHHRTGGAAARPRRSLSTGPGAVYPSHILTTTTAEELKPILTADQLLHCNVSPRLPVDGPSVNPGTSSSDWTREASICTVDGNIRIKEVGLNVTE